MKGLSQLRFLINFIQTTQIREAMVIMMMRRVLGNSLQVQSKSHDASSPLISGIGALKLPCRIFKTEHDPCGAAWSPKHSSRQNLSSWDIQQRIFGLLLGVPGRDGQRRRPAM